MDILVRRLLRWRRAPACPTASNAAAACRAIAKAGAVLKRCPASIGPLFPEGAEAASSVRRSIVVAVEAAYARHTPDSRFSISCSLRFVRAALWLRRHEHTQV